MRLSLSHDPRIELHVDGEEERRKKAGDIREYKFSLSEFRGADCMKKEEEKGASDARR